MRQIFQNLKTGEITQCELPVPTVKTGHLLIKTTKSLISLGTEKMLLEFGKAGWISKARQQPDKVQQVIQKIKTDGLQPTIKAVFNKLEQPLPLGYCNSGIVVDVGTGVHTFNIGDRVVSNGPHAEIVCVPENLCAKVPDKVDDATSSFTVLGAIGLQGIRLLNPTLGENIAVIGLGLIGLLSSQILRANGCRVIGFDFDPEKVDLARKFGVQAYNLQENIDPIDTSLAFSDGYGVDGVLITASTSSNDPIEQAPQMCRKRGRVVLIGVTGLKINRTEFYKKEISFQVSCSYGPGRYEEAYESKGLDYPIGFVRWTEQRNFQAILQLMEEGKLSTKELISKTLPFLEAEKAYQGANSNVLGIVFDYPDTSDLKLKVVPLNQKSNYHAESTIRIGAIGAGNFAGATLFPALAKTEANLVTIASAGGMSGDHLGKKFGFEKNTTDYKTILKDPEINTLVITTQHNTHAHFIIEGLEAGKHVFVEKPLALNQNELQKISEVYQNNAHLQLMVGFNRRYSPLTEKIKTLLQNRANPLAMTMTVNAGLIPADHWTQDKEKGGGRIIGEACHFIDLLMYLAESPVTSVSSAQMGRSSDQICEDKMSIQLTFEDGSIGTVNYFANGNKAFPKEKLEVFSDGKILQLDNFKKLFGFGFKGFRKMSLSAQDKGQTKEIEYFIQSTKSGEALIPFDQLKNTALASFAAVQSAAENRVIRL